MVSNRPQFWLQVRKDYIFDNFESLLNYLRQYTYTADDEHPDYNSTLECMTALSEDIGQIIRNTPFYKPLELGYGLNAVIRLFCATILASNKAGITPRRTIASLIDLVMKSPEIKIAESELIKIYHIALNCVRGRDMIRCGFNWDNISDPNLAPSMLIINFSRLSFRELPEDHPAAYIENRGLLVVPRDGDARMSVVNRHNFERGGLDTQFSLQDMMQVDVPRKEYEKAADFDRLYQITTRLLSEMDQMGPSPRTSLRTYDLDSDRFLVKVTSKRGMRIDAETIDPSYHLERGKVLLELPAKRPSSAVLNERLQEGDYLLVHLCKGEYRFEVIDAFEDFYRDYVCAAAAETRLAVFSSEYANGTEWITEDGMRVGVDKNKRAAFDEITAERFEHAMATGTPVELRLYNQPPRTDKDSFFAYADFTDSYAELGEESWFTAADADDILIDNFLEYCHERGRDMEEKGRRGSFMAAEPDLCIPMISTMARVVEAGLSSCRSRLEYITAVAMLCKVLSRNSELAYMEHERKFLYAQVMFAQNRPFSPLTHPAALDGVERVDRREQIVRTLLGYRKKDVTRVLADSDRGEDSLDKVSALVTASNSLIDIIDTIELNNIKQVIARSLSIEDEYVSILDDRTFYGMESISLEFKTSVVFPPANRRRYASAVADPELQKWVIIKAVCGFLNSRSGGELLLGVNDAGYAVGLADDMKKLYELREIISPDIDHYRTYLQLMLDRAFREPDQKVSSSDITQTHVSYNPEENAEGKTIMRISVRPYQKGIVSLAVPAADRPQGIEDSYVRLSGRTVPVTAAMRAEILRYKL